jgi:exosome complex component RRP4
MENRTREIVIPGQPLEGPGLRPGPGTFIERGRVYAALLGIRDERNGVVQVIPLAGRYIPRPGDAVIGHVTDHGPGHWLLDINAPYPAPLHAVETPWRVDYGDTASFLRIGDLLLAEVLSVDENRRVQVTLNREGLRKLEGGALVEVAPPKVPRVIGKKGSMVSLIKDFTRCRIFVGQNGRIWLDGAPEDMRVAEEAIRLIERYAQTVGLTETVHQFLEKTYGRKAN